jgi:predicted oxidoreductase (fatty acid repression mutant protein)
METCFLCGEEVPYPGEQPTLPQMLKQHMKYPPRPFEYYCGTCLWYTTHSITEIIEEDFESYEAYSAWRDRTYAYRALIEWSKIPEHFRGML